MTEHRIPISGGGEWWNASWTWGMPVSCPDILGSFPADHVLDRKLTTAAINKVVAEEREACAKIADETARENLRDMGRMDDGSIDQLCYHRISQVADNIADEIRGRGNK